MSSKLMVGVIGTGRIGRMHTENIKTYFSDEVEVKSVADIFIEKSRDWAVSLGIENIYKNYKDILKDPEIDAVLICSSTDTHCQFIVEAAETGKHIFCEKPIDFDLEKIKKALDIVDKSQVKLQIGFQRRFDHNFEKVRDMIKSGKIGKPHILKITSRDPEPPPIDYIKVSGGIFLDMMIHDFDMARYLIESEVEEVYAQAGVLVDPAIGEAGDVDTAVATLKFKDGTIGVIDNSRRSIYGYDQRVEVFGSEGCVVVGNDTESNLTYGTFSGVITEKPKNFFIERYKKAYIKELKAFFDSVRDDKDVAVSGIDGFEPILIGLAAKESLKTKKAIKIER